jgi:TolA-binding protein
MSCPTPIELSRALAIGIDARLQAHLDSCARCTTELESHANVVDDVRVLPVVDPDPDHARLVRASLMAAAAGPITRARPRLWLFGAGAATALAAAAILVVVLRTPKPDYRGTIHAQAGAQYIRLGGAPDEIVRLTQGTITVEVSPLQTGERFRVITADGEVEVRGTAFDVSAEGDRLTAVRVLHGKVEVRASGAAAKLLAPGERWEIKLALADKASTDDGADAVRAGVIQSDHSDTPDNHDADKPRADIAGAAAPRVPGADVPGTGVIQSDHSDTADSRVIQSDHSDTADNRGAAKPRVDKSVAAAPRADQSRSDKPRTDAPAITADQTPVRPAPPGAPKRAIEILFEQGWAALAAGKPSDAASAFERAATSAPNDPLAEDAWFWRASALARAKSSGAASALAQFLTRYPRSNRAGEASAMLGWIVIASDVDRAEQLFTAAAKDRVPAVRASAEKGLAAVAKQRGR